MKTLSGKTALVTGGSRGIGRAICIGLAQAGARVAFTYINNQGAAAETHTILEEMGTSVLSFQADVRETLKMRELFSATNEAWGALDVLVNNAGINNPTDFDQISDEDWDEVMSVNLKGPFICSREALPWMRDGGSIIHIGSVSGQYGGPRTAHYAASKAGLISLGQVIARFGASRGIRSNTVAAGLIVSDMAEAGLQSSAVRKAAAAIPLGRMGTPTEVADTVVYLASDASRYVTAQTINVNGGLYF